jgi:hypothetical protein
MAYPGIKCPPMIVCSVQAQRPEFRFRVQRSSDLACRFRILPAGFAQYYFFQFRLLALTCHAFMRFERLMLECSLPVCWSDPSMWDTEAAFMPFSMEYQCASQEFERFLRDALDASRLTTRNQVYTMTQAVFQNYRNPRGARDGRHHILSFYLAGGDGKIAILLRKNHS